MTNAVPSNLPCANTLPLNQPPTLTSLASATVKEIFQTALTNSLKTLGSNYYSNTSLQERLWKARKEFTLCQENQTRSTTSYLFSSALNIEQQLDSSETLRRTISPLYDSLIKALEIMKRENKISEKQLQRQKEFIEILYELPLNIESKNLEKIYSPIILFEKELLEAFHSYQDLEKPSPNFPQQLLQSITEMSSERWEPICKALGYEKENGFNWREIFATRYFETISKKDQLTAEESVTFTRISNFVKKVSLQNKTQLKFLESHRPLLRNVTDVSISTRLNSNSIPTSRFNKVTRTLKHIATTLFKRSISIPFQTPDLNGNKINSSYLDILKDMKNLRSMKVSCSLQHENLEYLKNCPEIEELDLRNSKVSGSQLKILRNLPNLKVLKLAGCNITDKHLKELKYCSKLEVLDLRNTNITGSCLQILKNLSNIKILKLAGCKITDDYLDEIKNCTKLEFLDLNGTRITHLNLTILKCFPNLKVLKLARCSVLDWHLKGLLECNNIECLDLSGTRINGSCVQYFREMTHLRKLLLGNTNFSDRFLHEELNTFKRIKELDFSGTNISGSCFRYLTGLQKLNVSNCTMLEEKNFSYIDKSTNLQKMNFSNTNITGQFLEEIEWLEYITELNFSGCDLLDESFLTYIQKCKKLTKLNLSRTGITGNYFEALKNLLNLESINLAQCRMLLTTRLETIVELPKLRKLDLSRTCLDDEIPLQKATNLEVLNLSSSYFVKKSVFEKIVHLRNLKQLDLSSTNITCHSIKRLSTLPQLETLKVNSSHFLNEHFHKHLESFQSLNTISYSVQMNESLHNQLRYYQVHLRNQIQQLRNRTLGAIEHSINREWSLFKRKYSEEYSKIVPDIPYLYTIHILLSYCALLTTGLYPLVTRLILNLFSPLPLYGNIILCIHVLNQIWKDRLPRPLTTKSHMEVRL